MLKDILEEKYTGVRITIKTKNGAELNGTIYGDDENFDLDGFYQYFVADNSGHLLKLYYAIDEDCDYDIIFQGFVRELADGRKEESFAMDADTSMMSKEEIICRIKKLYQ